MCLYIEPIPIEFKCSGMLSANGRHTQIVLSNISTQTANSRIFYIMHAGVSSTTTNIAKRSLVSIDNKNTKAQYSIWSIVFIKCIQILL